MFVEVFSPPLPWSVSASSTGNWISVGSVTGATAGTNGTFVLTFAANTGLSGLQSRSGTVTVSYAGGSVIVPVTQAAGTLTITPIAATVYESSTQAFSAAVNGTAVPVNWSVSCCGTLSPTTNSSTTTLTTGVTGGSGTIMATVVSPSVSASAPFWVTNGTSDRK